MIRPRGIRRLTAIVALLGMAQLCVIRSRSQTIAKDNNKTEPLPGQRTFASSCAGCHGLDGGGSERAPAIARSPKVRHLSDAQISHIISNGVAGTGMPPFGSLGNLQIRALVSYLRVLQGRSSAAAPAGNARRGREIFFGKGECSTCHSSQGEGGFFGPDLSGYGDPFPAKIILDMIVSPSRNPQAGYKAAAATTQAGERVEGLVRNEDNFSVQLLTRDGTFHFFQKSELQSFEYLDHSVMPADYGTRLAPEELNDLVAYLMSVAGPPPALRVPEK